MRFRYLDPFTLLNQDKQCLIQRKYPATFLSPYSSRVKHVNGPVFESSAYFKLCFFFLNAFKAKCMYMYLTFKLYNVHWII